MPPSAPPSDATAPLSGQAVLVTGASSGIGRAIALACARAGADLALTYRANADGAREVAAQIEGMGRRAFTLQLDLADQGSIATLGPSTRTALGRIDAWINNAGGDILTGHGAAMSYIEKMDYLLRVDLRGTMLASWQAVEIMKAQPNGGVVINVSWDHITQGMSGDNPQLYSAVKGGISSFSKSLARSVAPHVRVNLLAPGWISTAFGEGVKDKPWYRAVEESTPMRRWGTPEDVAGAAVYLASPAAAFLTGQTIMIGGGIIM